MASEYPVRNPDPDAPIWCVMTGSPGTKPRPITRANQTFDDALAYALQCGNDYPDAPVAYWPQADPDARK